MKLFIALLLTGCTVSKHPQTITLTVSHVNKNEAKTEVYCNRGYMVYYASFNRGTGADTLKWMDKITAFPINSKDTCLNVFRRIK